MFAKYGGAEVDQVDKAKDIPSSQSRTSRCIGIYVCDQTGNAYSVHGYGQRVLGPMGSRACSCLPMGPIL
eukprot:5638559-Amphidinium_carterae.1